MVRGVACGPKLLLATRDVAYEQGCGLWPGIVCDRGCWSGMWFVARDGL